MRLPHFLLSILSCFYLAIPQKLCSQSFTDMSVQNDFSVTGQNRGIAIGDFNGDGLEDIYLSSMSRPNLLYKNLGNFNFEEVAAQYGVNNSSSTSCSLWFDLENDGDLDLFLANIFEPNILYRNDGDTFTDVSNDFQIGSIGNPKSLHAVDYDNDGDLDLYVAQVFDQNILWRNESGQAFTDITEIAGIDDRGRSLGAIFFDYDLDGDQDLYQTRDGDDPNLFWENNGDGTFTEISAALGLDFVGFGMGADIADLNGDLRPDIYLTNLYENKLYLSNAHAPFDEVAETAGVADIGMGWSTFFFDCNNDGLSDIYVANDSYFGVNGIKPSNRLFLNNGNQLFSSEDYEGNVQNTFGSYGAATADFDLDGKLDLAIANNGSEDGNQLFRNTSVEQNYIGFKLRGRTSNADGIGCRVALYYNETIAIDFVNAGSGYASQSSSRLHFGLGDVTGVDSVVLFWPSGIKQKLDNPAINQLHIIEEGQTRILSGEVVWTDPLFPSQFDDITLFFDAKEGNSALAGYTGDVYAHTGVITSQSTNANDWRYVIGNWGTADARVLMSRVGEDLYSLSYNIQDFYGLPPGEEVFKMAFVFRDVAGNIVGRSADGSDIFTDVFPSTESLFISLISPEAETIITEGDSILINVQTSLTANLRILDNGVAVFLDSTDQVEFYLSPQTVGLHTLSVTATTPTDTVSLESRYFVVEKEQVLQDPPTGVRDGLNYLDSTYVFQLFAPNKNHAFLLSPANNFSFHSDFLMHKSTDETTFWIELPRSYFENGKNTYQYLVDGQITVADPYSEVVLDPVHDPFIDDSLLSELPAYPSGASGIVTVFDLEKTDYNWLDSDFEPVAKTDLIIYELLIRDLLQDHSYQSLTDTLNYLEKLGVTAIELMPIHEFEGNISWGYNPSFHLAVDKYYGTRDDLKRFVDEAHSRGIAVIVDVVFNHAFSQSPLAQLYWDKTNFRPSEDNPWLNVTPRHPFNVGYDFNHESLATRKWVKRSLERWILDFHIDGFRFDLSKGFTQRFSGNDAGLMAQYDPSRIAILKEYADYIWSLNPKEYVTLEHFAENREEKELANYGMMLWGNNNFQFAEAAMGYRSDLENADYTFLEWNDPNLIAYMESHDEERLMYKILRYGDQNSAYNTRELATALQRVAAASTIFYSIPGPKMLWQFGELGYELSINYCADGSVSPDCRLDPKPIRWEDLLDQNRQRLYQVTSALMHLKTQYPTFSSRDFTFNDGNFFLKTVHLNHPEMDAVALANFRVVNSDINPKFQDPGTWYEYFSGDSIQVVDVNEKLTFLPGEYRIYTSKRIQPPSGFITNTTAAYPEFSMELYPNPVQAGESILIRPRASLGVFSVKLRTMHGVEIPLEAQGAGDDIRCKIPREMAAGVYFLQFVSHGASYTRKLLIF